MTATGRMTCEEMEARLQEAEGILTALRSHEVDAVIGDTDVAMVHLREVEEALRTAQEELERRVAERTAELAQVNRELHDTIEEQGRIRRRLEDGEQEYRALVEDLTKSEKRLLKAQQIARIGNWEVDLEDHTGWWSDETYRVLGLEPGQVEPGWETAAALIHPQDRDVVAQLRDDALEGKRPFNVDHRIIRPDGEERFVHSEAEIEFNAEGRPVRMIGILQCITDRKRAQIKLEESASQLQGQAELLDLADDMIFVHDMQGRIVFWNRGAEQAYGWTREEANGQLSHQLLQTEYSEPLIRITAKIIRESHWEGELVHTTRDGRKIIVASRWALRRGPGGRPVAILEIDSDITARKRAEQEIVEAKQFAESIVNTIQEALIVLDSQLRVVSANRVFYEICRKTTEQVEGRLFYMLSNGRWDIPDLRSRLRQVLSDNASFQGYELACELPDEQHKTLVLGAQPISGPADQPRMILVVMQDISMQKQHEKEIQADKEQLSALTEELLLTEERQRQRVAAALHDSISQSLAFAKRELGVLEEQAPHPMRGSLEEVCDQIGQAINLVRDLTLELAPSVLYTLGLEAAIEDLADQFSGGDGFVCRVHVTEEPKPLSDEVKSLVYRAVRELLVNVSKHAQAKNVVIDVRREESNIAVTVDDDGRGFRPPQVSGGPESGGFGLSSIQQRLTHVGGKLTIESGEGKGTRVTLIAPLDLG